MRLSIIRLIWMRELRDQLRDRRTVFMIAVLPILLYPVAGVGLMEMASSFGRQPQFVAVYGAENLPAYNPAPAASWLDLAPAGPGAPLAGAERAASAIAFVRAQQAEPRQAFPPLFGPNGDGLHVLPAYFDNSKEQDLLKIQLVEFPSAPAPPPDAPEKETAALLAPFRKPLEDQKADLVVVVYPDFLERIEAGERPSLYLLSREGDEHSRFLDTRFAAVLTRWKKAVKEVRLARHGLAVDFDDPVEVHDPEHAKPTDLFSMLVRIFPFVLVMWSLAGALYPAVDLCAGEKERGTMETLLISPVSREEIVWGKFLTIWVFSAATALLNLLSMGLTTWYLSSNLPNDAFRPEVIFWSVLLVLPLSAFFSAVCLAVGAYARSSKEGQYYLMPLFLLTMPLIFLTLAPGVELNPFYSMVPVTGVALLLQKLMSAGPKESSTWLYFVPVLAPMVVYSWLALRWAIGQFKREEVLFREAERLDVGLWLKRLFREKESLPTVGEALFCFGLLCGLRWFSFSIMPEPPKEVYKLAYKLAYTSVAQLAFTAAPPLFMALLLTTRPRLGLALRSPPLWVWGAVLLMAVLTLPPLAELVWVVRDQFPSLQPLLEEYHPLAGDIQGKALGVGASPFYRVLALVVLAVLPAVCRELAFRGFILTGLSRRFHLWTAVFLSSFLFALFQMNVFQFAPHFVFGVFLAVLTVRTGSVFPAMVFHFVYKAVLIGPGIFPEIFDALTSPDGLPLSPPLRQALAVVCALLATALLAGVLWYGKQAKDAIPPTAAKEPLPSPTDDVAAAEPTRQSAP